MFTLMPHLSQVYAAMEKLPYLMIEGDITRALYRNSPSMQEDAHF